MPLSAHAFFSDVQICAEYRVDYGDATTNYTHETDYFKNNDDKPAWGAEIVVREATSLTVVHSVYSAWDGADPGCVTVSLDDFTSYQVKIRADAEVNGNRIVVRNDDTNHNTWVTPWSSSFQPIQLANGTYIAHTGLHQAWNVAAAAGWAMKRRNAGLADETFYAYTCGCPLDDQGVPYTCDDLVGGKPARTKNCWEKVTDRIYLATTGEKFSIVHELGHGVTDFVNGHDFPEKSYLAEGDACQVNGSDAAHFQTSKEYNSAAIVEGYADYYAAVAFNETDQLSCTWWRPLRPNDWNHDGMFSPAEEEPFSCYGAPVPNEPSYDYYGYYCVGGAEDDNRGNEFDWLRFLWELDQDYGESTTEIFAVIVDANADAWDQTTDGTGVDAPSSRMRAAAVSVDPYAGGLGEDWGDREVVHGVHR